MLQVHVIKDHKEAYAKALKKRGLDATTKLNPVTYTHMTLPTNRKNKKDVAHD